MLSLEGFTTQQLRASLGAEIARAFTLENDMVLTPKLGLTTGFSGLDGSGLFGSLSAGLTLQSVESWSVDTGVLVNLDAAGGKSLGAKIGIRGGF